MNKQLIEKAKDLISSGKDAFNKLSDSDQEYYKNTEQFVVYDKAIKLLLKHGFIEREDEELQKAFYQLIPPPKQYTETDLVFEKLYSSNKNERITSSKFFDKKARDEWSGWNASFFQYPKTFERLFPALKDEEPKVVRNIIVALGCAG